MTLVDPEKACADVFMSISDLLPPRTWLDPPQECSLDEKVVPKMGMMKHPFKIFIYTDEAHTLIPKCDPNNPHDLAPVSTYVALHLALASLYKLVFALFMSTHSRLNQLLEQQQQLLDSAQQDLDKQMVPAFTKMSFNIVPISLSNLKYSEVHSVKFIASFGRPL